MSNETKWTKGPWEYRNGRVSQVGNDRYWDCIRVSGVSLATGYVSEDDEAFANANLFAAGPEMYWALKEMLEESGSDPMVPLSPGEKMALAALAKARGETS